MEVLNDDEKNESTKSDLDDMWYTGDKESNIQDLEDEDLVDNEDFKEETNANVVDGLHVPHDEIDSHRTIYYLGYPLGRFAGLKHRQEGVQKGNKETPLLVEIGSPSTALDEPNITFVEKDLRPRYVLKSQDVIGIDDDKFKYP
jgi:hypothetical protein